MGVDGRLGDRKKRQLEQVVGRPLVIAIAVGTDLWEGVTGDDTHYLFRRRSGQVSVDTDPCHFSTCPSVERPVGVS